MKAKKQLTEQQRFNKEDRESTLLMYAFLFGLTAILILAFCSCTNTSYSPIDSYLKATIKNDSLNAASYNDAVKFIDSLNNSH